ncbi:MAG TPA: hypothetical protein VII91_07190 [Bauldia sp.]
MGDSLNVLHQAGQIVRSGLAVALAEPHRRIAGIAGLNVLAVGLAFAALQMGGTILSKNHVSSIAAAEPGEATVAPVAPAVKPLSLPIPHRAPPAHVAYAATPDREVLFADPVAVLSSFGSAPPSGDTGAFVVSPAQVISPVSEAPPPAVVASPPTPVTLAPVATPATLAPLATPVAKVAIVAKTRHKTVLAHHRGKVALHAQIADNNVDADIAGQVDGVAVSASTGLGISANAAASVAGGLSSVASATTSGVAGVASSVSAATGSVTGAVGGAVAGVGGVAAGVAGSVGVGAR